MKIFSKPPQQQLDNLVEYYNTGRYDDAEKLSLSITQEFPEHPFSWKVLAILQSKSGKIIDSLVSFENSVKLNPQDPESQYNFAYALQKLNKLSEAEKSYRKAITLKPNYIEAYNNLGVVLRDLNKLIESEESYKQAIKHNPLYAEAHNNLGSTLTRLGKLDEAEKSYRQAIKHNPLYAEAHNNLGSTLTRLGKLDEAEQFYKNAITIKPDYAEGYSGLSELLTIFTPKDKTSHQIIKIDQEIRKNYLDKKNLKIISDEKIIQLLFESTSVIKKYNLEVKTGQSQAYRRNSFDLNCERHFTIFNKYKIIPRFCFECYKVLVEPKTILDLIKLFIVFDQIKLLQNNSRKCMIEMRPEISGFYKGYIYCSSLDEAYKIANYLELIIKENIGSGMRALVKRGCSEFSISFPDYKAINKSGKQLMNYNEEWLSIEEEHDSLYPTTSNKIITPSLFGLNLNDILIIRNWIDYAKGIGDSSVNLLNQQIIFSPAIYEKAKIRIEKHPWQ